MQRENLAKAKSRLNQSRQKRVGTRMKDKNRKQKEKENDDLIPTSTERVREI